ncbi:MAG: TonB family protein, partial [Polyangiales bacterium]
MGRPLCTAVCVCVLCTRSAWAQEEPPTPAPTPDDSETPPAPEAPAVTPPRVLQAVEARYPPDALAAGREASVELAVTVQADGSVGAVTVARSAGAAFDEAAIAALRQWRFAPARQGEQAIASRIRVPFRFTLPEAAPLPVAPGGPVAPDSDAAADSSGDAADGDAAADSDATADRDAGGGDADGRGDPTLSSGGDAAGPRAAQETPIDVTVRGERNRRPAARGASDFQIERAVLAAAPRQEGADVLSAAPGVFVARAAGPAVAHSYMLRGFDAEHGQDIAFRVGGLPINLPSHI